MSQFCRFQITSVFTIWFTPKENSIYQVTLQRGRKMHDLVKDVNSGLVESMTRLKSSLIINYYDGRSLIINSDLIDIAANSKPDEPAF